MQGFGAQTNKIGRILDAVPDNATIVLTGDHGEEFGQFEDFHEASLYSTMTNVPIIVQAPGIDSGRSKMPAQHLDIPVTFLHTAGVDIPEGWNGEPLHTAEREPTEPIFHTLGPEENAVRAGEWKLIDSPQENGLYQVPHGEIETEPIENKVRFEELQTLIDEYRSAAGTAGVGKSDLGEEDDLSKEVEDNLEDLGYL